MKNVTQTFKDNIKKYGRQLDAVISVNNETIDSECINSIISSFNTDLFKSVMKVLEIDSNIKINKDSILNLKVGVKFDSNYEYINYNNYKVVKEPEIYEDTLSYKIMAYDKMVESMIDYDLQLTEKLTVRQYLIAICKRLGWNTSNIPANFINCDKLIDPSLHSGIKYTFRDALDEIATITCSFLYFDGDIFCLGYVKETGQIIDEEYLSENDVAIKEQYFINSLVFSRAEESDNIYRKDDSSIAEFGLHEYRVADNQLLSTNDRDLYIDEMFEYLRNFTFYLYDVKSTGILFLDICDGFSFNIRGNTYSTIMLNSEINITQGLEERLYIDEIKSTETDYKYADTTDKRINQTYILVDKQNQKIEQLVQESSKYEEKLTQVTQTVDEIEQGVQSILDFQREVSGKGQVYLENTSDLDNTILKIKITGETTLVYPSTNTYPSPALYPRGQYINLIIDTKPFGQMTAEHKELKIQMPFALKTLVLENETIYDEIIIENCIETVIKRIGLAKDENGSVYKYKLDEPIMTQYKYINIPSFKGGTYIYSLIDSNIRYEATYLVDNDYVRNFATKVQLNTAIFETESSITQSVNAQFEDVNGELQEVKGEVSLKIDKGDTGEIISAFNVAVNEVTIKSDNFTLEKDGTITANKGTFKGTINTDKDLRVGNNVYIGQNQNSTSDIIKYLFFANDAYIRRWLFENGSYLRIQSGYQLNLSCGTTSIFLFNDNDIQMSTQPSYSSDIRLKKNIKEINVDWIDELNIKEFEYKNSNDKKEIGLIAQDYLEKDYSKLFLESYIDSGGKEYYSIRYGNITNALVKYCQELKKQINQQQGKIEDLQNQINELYNAIDMRRKE